MKVILTLAAFFCLAQSSSSAIFFIDLNDATAEVEAAKKEAAAQGRSFQLCPHPYGVNDLTNCLRDAKEKGIQSISSLIVSGHHHNGTFTFFGISKANTESMVTKDDLQTAFANFPEYRDSIKNIHLAGCYSTLPGATKYQWDTIFPNAGMVDGFEETGPLRTDALSPRFLKWALTKERFLNSSTPEQIQRELNGNKELVGKKLAVCSREDFISRTKIVSDALLRETCANEQNVSYLKSLYEPVDCYMKAKEDKCANPDSSDEGPIRKFYAEFQRYDVCFDVDPTLSKKFNGFPQSKSILYLIDFKDVLKNFTAYFGADLATTQSILGKLQETKSIQLTKIGSMSRKQVLEVIDKMRSTYQTLGDGLSVAEKKQFNKTLSNMTVLLENLSPGCIPLSWVLDTKVGKTPPVCQSS